MRHYDYRHEAISDQLRYREEQQTHEPSAELNYQAIRELLAEDRLIVDFRRGYVYAPVIRNGAPARKEISRGTKSGLREVGFWSKVMGRRFYLKRSHIVWCAVHPDESIPKDHSIIHLNGRKNDDRADNLLALPQNMAASSRVRAWFRNQADAQKCARPIRHHHLGMKASFR